MYISKNKRRRFYLYVTSILLTLVMCMYAYAGSVTTTLNGAKFSTKYTSKVNFTTLQASVSLEDISTVENAYYCKARLICVSEAGNYMYDGYKVGLDYSGTVSTNQSYWYMNSKSKRADYWIIITSYSSTSQAGPYTEVCRRSFT